MHPTNFTCKNCGNDFRGKFCNECGEKVYTQKDKSLVHIFDEVFHFITHLDGTLLTTIKTFFSRPGKMSADYTAGIRKKYFKPLSFFLLIVIAYLLFPRFSGLNMKFSTYISKEYGFQWYASPVAKQKITTHHLTAQQLAGMYDAKSPAFAKISLFLLVPLAALVLMLLFYTGKKYFFDHFIVSTELIAFYIISQFLFLPFLSFITEKTVPGYLYLFDDGSWLWKMFYFLFFVFTACAFRNFYKQAVWLSAVKAFVFLFVFFAGIKYVYSLILYYLVMLFI